MRFAVNPCQGVIWKPFKASPCVALSAFQNATEPADAPESGRPLGAARGWGILSLTGVRNGWKPKGEAVPRETSEALLSLFAVGVGFGREVVAGSLGEPSEHSTFQTLTPACTDFHDVQYALLYCSHLGGNRSFLFGFWQFCTQLRFPH